MNKLIQTLKDFIDFVSFYPGYSITIFIIGFILGSLHQYYGL